MTKNSSKRKFNFIDALIIIVIISAIVFGVNKYKKSSIPSPNTPQTNKIKITYYIEEIPEYVAEAIEIGDPVREKIQNSNFGTITDMKVDKSVSWAKRDDGEFFRSSREGYNSLTLTMEATGVLTESGATIDKSVYYIGQTVAIFAGNSMLETGRISGIEILEN